MKAKITFKRQNPDFDKEYAEQYHHGKESDGNWKDEWSFTAAIDGNVTEFNIRENTSIQLMDSKVEKVTFFEYKIDKEEICQFVVSSCLIDKTHKVTNSRYGSSHFYVYFKQTSDYYTYRNGQQLMYLACEEFPQELLKYIQKN